MSPAPKPPTDLETRLRAALKKQPEALFGLLDAWAIDPNRDIAPLNALAQQVCIATVDQGTHGPHLLPLLQRLLDLGVDPNLSGRGGLLSCAAAAGNTRLAKELIARGAHVNGSDNTSTPLQQAVYYNHLPMLRLLVKHGADIHHEDAAGNTLILRTQRRRRAMRQFLVDQGADPLAVNGLGRNLLSCIVVNHAIGTKAEHIIQELRQVMDWGVRADQEDHEGHTPLSLARQSCPEAAVFMEHYMLHLATDQAASRRAKPRL